jgi:hypothetical protein
MVIPAEGTFDYVFDIEGDIRTSNTIGRPREPLSKADRGVVGHAPVLTAVDYQREAWQVYARLTLTASDPRNAGVAHASFSVDRALVNTLRRGDLVYLARTNCGGLGLSVLREGALIAAAGAVTDVPLGSDNFARIPADLVRQVESVFRTRDGEYRMPESPVELSLCGETKILHSGRPQMGLFDVFVRHGFLNGVPGMDVSASIERRGVCPATAAHTSAQLLEELGLQLSRD